MLFSRDHQCTLLFICTIKRCHTMRVIAFLISHRPGRYWLCTYQYLHESAGKEWHSVGGTPCRVGADSDHEGDKVSWTDYSLHSPAPCGGEESG